MNSRDMIFCEKNGKIYSCGYNINSLFLENNIKPIYTKNNFAIPAGLTSVFKPPLRTSPTFTKYGLAQDTLFDKLLNLMDNDEKIKYKQQKTQKRKMRLKCRRKSCKNKS